MPNDIIDIIDIDIIKEITLLCSDIYGEIEKRKRSTMHGPLEEPNPKTLFISEI